MPIPTFTPNYPLDGSTLGQTKKVIRDNLDGTFQTLAIDHIDNNGNPGGKPAGYHKVIHSVPQGGNPGVMPGIGQLYCKTVTPPTPSGDQALFWETGGGIVQQLTANITPVSATNGVTFLPGGLILQWGTTGNISSGTPVLFISGGFPTNNAFSVIATNLSNTNNRKLIYTSGYTKTQFIPTIIDASGNTTSAIFTWWAIGN